MPPGATQETVDGMSLEKLDAIIAAVRQERYRWTPVRRTDIPKKSGQLRPLGLPTWSDKLLQEVIRLILEAYYEPQFSPHAHGFRPGRGCPTALGEITQSWSGVQWFIEGDIAQCFERLNHEVMLSILSEGLHDKRFLRMIANLRKAGYVEEWRFNATLRGAPHGGVVSPILSLIYLDRLAQCVETILLPAHNRGDRRKPSPPYRALLNAARNQRIAGALEEARALRKQAQTMPSRDPNDAHFRRLWDVRYADDWRVGLSGPREEADAIKEQLNECLRDTRQLKLSYEKTVITNARTQSARFLGDEVLTQDAHDKQFHALHRRCLNGAPGLKIPEEVIRAKCAKYMQHGAPSHLAARLNDSAFSRVTQYQAEYRGFGQCSLMADNAHRLWRVHRGMPLSLVFTLADKHRTSAQTIFRKDKATVTTAHGPLKVLEAKHERGKDKAPLRARFGGIELRWQRGLTLNDQPKEVYGNRREVVQRLLAQECELCGATDHCAVHPLRKLADLHRPGQREKPLWVRRMASRRRKTLVTCRKCHEDIHRERSSRRKVTG